MKKVYLIGLNAGLMTSALLAAKKEYPDYEIIVVDDIKTLNI